MAPAIFTPRDSACFSCSAASANSVVPGMITTHGCASAAIAANSGRRIGCPSPNPYPPEVEGLWPIMADSVMMVSVMVSMAMSPITGVASFSNTTLRSFR